MTEPLVLAYLAGVLDSDGYIGVRRSTHAQRHGLAGAAIYAERIQVKMTHPAAIDLFRATFGGYRSITRAQTPNGKPLHAWGATARVAADALIALRPYMRVKCQQADNALRLRALLDASRHARVAPGRGHVGGAPRPAAITNQMETCYQRALALNAQGIIDRRAPRQQPEAV